MSMTTRQRNTTRNLLTGFGGRLLVVLLRFITRTVFIHTLGKSYLGINGLFSDILTMLSLTELGIGTALNYRLYKPLAHRNDHDVRVLVKFYRQAYMVIGCAIFILGLILMPFLPYLISDYDTLEVLGINAILIFSLYMAKTICSYLFFAYRSAVVAADQKNYIIETVDMIGNAITIGLQIAVLVIWCDFILYTAVEIFATILKNVVMSVIATRRYPTYFIKEKDSMSKAEVVTLLKDSGALFLLKIISVIITASDSLVLSAFLGLTAVGLYANYVLFKSALTSLIDKFYSACQASMGNLFATHDDDTNYSFFEVMNFLTVLLYGTCCVGIVVIVDEVMEAWIGSEYLIAQPFALAFGVSIFFAGIRNNLNKIREITGIFRQMWYSPLVASVVNLVVSILLVHRLGITGVVCGTILADVIVSFLISPFIIYRYAFQGRFALWEFYAKNIGYILVLTLVGCGDWWLCQRVFTGFGWLSVFVHTFICGVSVPLVLVALFYRTKECKYLVDTGLRMLGSLKKRKSV